MTPEKAAAIDRAEASLHAAKRACELADTDAAQAEADLAYLAAHQALRDARSGK